MALRTLSILYTNLWLITDSSDSSSGSAIVLGKIEPSGNCRTIHCTTKLTLIYFENPPKNNGI